jgi:hypothetical protein
VIDFEAIILHWGPQAVATLTSPDWGYPDREAIEAVRTPTDPIRIAVMRDWLQRYRVFLGIEGRKRTNIAAAVLQWADSPNRPTCLSTADAICAQHESLREACIAAYGKERNFTSLASKALWLRYPEDVPLFDSYVKRTLWVLSKLESGIVSPDNGASEYQRFVTVWKAFYDRYKTAWGKIEMKGYKYPVRAFDVMLWMIGSPGYS